jgi:hypothetical protein
MRVFSLLISGNQTIVVTVPRKLINGTAAVLYESRCACAFSIRSEASQRPTYVAADPLLKRVAGSRIIKRMNAAALSQSGSTIKCKYLTQRLYVSHKGSRHISLRGMPK